MKEKPIIFSTESVRAILSGKKTQTRRVIKMNLQIETDSNDKSFFKIQDEYGDGHDLIEYCPYEIGQTLWVRETFSIDRGNYIYKANDIDILQKEGMQLKWKSSRFMPRKAARLFLIVPNIRIERLQDISEEDAKDEGVDSVSLKNHPRQATMSRRADFKQLWDSINKKRGYGWDKNPLVWAYDFEIKEIKR